MPPIEQRLWSGGSVISCYNLYTYFRIATVAYITECGDPVFILYLLIDTYLLPTYNRVSLTASSYSNGDGAH